MTKVGTVCPACEAPAVKAGWCNACYLRLRRRGTTKYARPDLVLPPVEPLFLAWCAGLFEGEGHVGIRPPGPKNLGALVVGIPNTQLDLIEPFFARWGGVLQAATQNKAHHSPIFRWVVRSRRAAA